VLVLGAVVVVSWLVVLVDGEVVVVVDVLVQVVEVELELELEVDP
jgi:hypothetical protein